MNSYLRPTTSSLLFGAAVPQVRRLNTHHRLQVLPSRQRRLLRVSQTVGKRAASAANMVIAPMVGTFYRSPSPGAPSFVEVGGKVKVGDPIGIIEVMKLFTTIHAEWSGTVTEVGAENATLVEYGQMLFVITPD